MKFIIRTALRIVLLILLFIVPVGLLITVLALIGRDVPLWNIGIRNILAVSKNLLGPIVFACYLFSTLFAIALVDKMKVRSLFLLHIPPLIVGAAIGAVLSFTGKISTNTDISIGYRTFLKEGVFNRADGSNIYISSTAQGGSNIFIYDRDGNTFVPLNNVSLGRTLKVDTQKRLLVVTYEGRATRYSKQFPFEHFSRKDQLTRSRFVRFYAAQVRSLLQIVRSQYDKLGGRDRTVYSGLLFLSVLLFSIPLAYAMNDRGWGFFGIVGIFLILFILPLFYRAVFGIVAATGGAPEFLGRYSFLLTALVTGGCGILIDIAVAIHGRRRARAH
jgi:hypothetical protein